MRPQTLWSLASTGRLGVLGSVGKLTSPFYRACFIVAAARSGLLRVLREGPRSLAEIAGVLTISESDTPSLSTWLDVGLGAGVLRRQGDAYTLSRSGRALALAENDDLVALLDEMVELHRRLILETPERLRVGRRFTLADHDSEVTARASRLLESFIHEALDPFVSPRGTVRLLEIGCGSGAHIRAAAARNPELHALGLELSPAVAEMARRNLESWGLGDRATVEVGDVRNYTAVAPFDLVTMHQNIYYFTEPEQESVLAHVRGLLAPHGRLLVTTACSGGSSAMAVLSLWGSVTEGCSPLPDAERLKAMLAGAGFSEIRARNLLAPLDRFFAFYARAP